MKTSEKPVVVSEDFGLSRERVWKAITNLEDMKCWYFENIDTFEAEVGCKSEFPVQSGEHLFLHLWEVTEVVYKKRITYNWRYGGYAGDAFVTFSLSKHLDCTRLTLEFKVVEDFQDDIPEFSRESCQAGWEYFINGRLKNYLEQDRRG